MKLREKTNIEITEENGINYTMLTNVVEEKKGRGKMIKEDDDDGDRDADQPGRDAFHGASPVLLPASAFSSELSSALSSRLRNSVLISCMMSRPARSPPPPWPRKVSSRDGIMRRG